MKNLNFKHGQSISFKQAASIIEKIGGNVSVSVNGAIPVFYAANDVAKNIKNNKDGWRVANIFQNYGNGAVILLKEGGDVGHLHLAKDFIVENNRYILKI